jgi:hypothetical protein
MAVITYAITGTTHKKKWIKKAIKKALAKGGTGTVFASTDPMHSAIIGTAITDIMEETMVQYGDCCDDPDYYEMSDEKAPDAKDQESAPADNPNPACGEKCVDQEPEEWEDEYEYTPLEQAVTLTEAQCAYLNRKGFYFLEQLIMLEKDELYVLGEEQYGIITSVRLWLEQYTDKDYSAETK